MLETDSAVHLLALRKALGQRNAAVMVGAGFSLNAEGGEQLSDWASLARNLQIALDPAEAHGVTPVLQLGEQYARVFSAPALEQFLKQHVPDDKVSPGLLHQKLLELPWTEIFTTNYDTLLERAADDIVEPAHFPVICCEDLPQSKIDGRRRIVKLHGSFPSQRPFIFTEEDYRRYPSDFAPFVNTVRQALLENVFCLVGFSGDDPNFLHWIGWVRDMLDRHALPIYLFVASVPSLGQRKLLETRNVVPVLLPKPNGTDAADYKARYLELFRLLAEPVGQPAADWGDAPWPKDVDHSIIQDKSKRFERFLLVFSGLTGLRSNYPGWLIAPDSTRQRFGHFVERPHEDIEHEWVRERLEIENPQLVVALAELYVWQQCVLLQPLNDEVARMALVALRRTTPLTPALVEDQKEQLASFGITKSKHFLSAWSALALGLLNWAREESELDDFATIVKLIKTSLPDDFVAADEVVRQNVLLALGRGEAERAREQLLSWTIRSPDPYVHVQKGALLAETDEPDLGLESCLEGIRRIRRAQKLAPDNLMLLSKEAWACLVANNISRALTMWSSSAVEHKPDDAVISLSKRVADIAARGYDARRELDGLLASANSESQLPTPPRSRLRSFDIGRSGSTPLTRTLQRRPKMATRSVYVEAKEVQR